MLVTNDVQSTQIPLLVEGPFPAGHYGEPLVALHGRGPAGPERVTRQLVVKGKKPFRILSVTCDDKSFHLRRRLRQDAQDAAPGPRLVRCRAKTRGRSVARSRSRPTWATRLPSWRPTRSCRHRNGGARDQGENGDWLRRPRTVLPASSDAAGDGACPLFRHG